MFGVAHPVALFIFGSRSKGGPRPDRLLVQLEGVNGLDPPRDAADFVIV